jgi:hypothetical protein
MGIDYAWQQLHLASELAKDASRTPQSRIADAYLYNLSYIREEFVPSEVWARLQNICKTVTWRNSKGFSGTVPATTSQMSDPEAQQVIDEILSLYDKVNREFRKSREG